MNEYQAVFDAVRSRISPCDTSSVIASQIDFSFAIDRIANHADEIASELQRPCVIFRPAISIDGNKWCALYGDNLQDGVAGFGDSPGDAMAAFDGEWHKTLKGVGNE